MENVPKIVHERLGVATPIADHPDADILSAFVELSLPEVERAGVLNHLSRCAECREIVALALPETQRLAASIPASSSRLLAWPTLRWGFAAAGLMVVFSLGVLQYQRQRAQPMMAAKTHGVAVTEAKNEPLPAVPSPEPTRRDKSQAFEKEKTVSAATSTQNERTADGKASPEPEAAAAPQVSAGGRGFGQALAHGPRALNQMQQSADALQARTTPPSQFANQAPSQAGNAPSAQQLSRQAHSLAVQPAYNYADAKVEKTKPVESVASGTAWRITSDGGVERSLDQGSTWQGVDVRANGSVIAGGNFMAAQTAPDRANKAAPPATNAGAPPVFRAVASNGADVWVGGLAALLYHSIDGGNHWIRVLPSNGSSVLAGDISSLSFPDSQHGTVSTSSSQLWTTADGGQTWQLQ